jgi:hypothetical protein
MKLLKSKTSSLKLLLVALFVLFGVTALLPTNPNTSVGSGQDAKTLCLGTSVANSGIGCLNNIKLAVVNSTGGGGATTTTTDTTTHGCGSNGVSGTGYVQTSIDFGCQGDKCGYSTTGYCATQHSALPDILFALIRFLSNGVGIVVVGSIIVGGIQYIGSRGDPNSTSTAINRIRSAVVALIIFIFSYAILNYVVPVGFFHQ